MDSMLKARTDKAARRLKADGVAGLLLFPGPELFYLTGCGVGLSERPACAVIPFAGESSFVMPRLESDRTQDRSWISAVRAWQADPFAHIAAELERAGLSRAVVGIPDAAPWAWVQALAERLPGIRFVGASGIIGAVRAAKDEAELAHMRESCRVIDQCVAAGFGALKEGMTESELAGIILSEILRRGAGIDFCLALFGENAALPHGKSGARRLRPGDLVLVDAGCVVKGYHSDITRTVAFGPVSAKATEVWETVFRAFQAAATAARPGVTCGELDAVARGVIEQAGYGQYFIHRLGHGIGLRGHEDPYLDAGNVWILEPGNTFTIEPGIYLPGELGVRIEDTFVCTPGGCEPLTRHPHGMRVRAI